jgi:hypothetical protein
VQRDGPGRAVLGAAHDQQALLEVNITVIEADHLAHPHAADGEQTNNRFHGRSLQWRAEPSGGSHQRYELVLGVQKRRRSAPTRGDQTRRGHLVCRVDGVEVAGESAEDTQPLGAPAGVRVRGEYCPGEGQINPNMVRAGRLGIGDEVG